MIDELNAFVTIVENETYQNAAAILHISQSSLSKKIIKLEKEYNVVVFDRSKRNVQLTPAGKQLYKQAKIIIQDYNKSKNMMQAFTSNEKMNITIGTLPYFISYSKIISDYLYRKQPKIELNIYDGNEQELIRKLKDREYQMILTRKESINPDEFLFFSIGTNELVAIVNQFHPLSKYTSLYIKELQNEKIITMSKHTCIYNIFRNACIEKGFNPNIVRETRADVILKLVELNESVGIIIREDLDQFKYNDLIVIPLVERISSQIVLCTTKGRSNPPITKNLFNLLKKQFEISS